MLSKKILCPIKINLTLRVLPKRDDGYHNIYSLFWQKKAIEGLTICLNSDENKGDILRVKGQNINGTNLVTKTLELVRSLGGEFPYLAMDLDKKYPQGSGIGAGSGNAAALLKWLATEYGVSLSSEKTGGLGADVAFLASPYDVALATGIGTELTPFSEICDLSWVLAFPVWASSTAEAYRKLDIYREKNNIPCFTENLDAEVFDVHRGLSEKKKLGLLPNDFLLPLEAEHHEYKTAGLIAQCYGALAWGLCGSGSAYFAVCKDEASALCVQKAFEQENWISKTSKLE